MHWAKLLKSSGLAALAATMAVTAVPAAAQDGDRAPGASERSSRGDRGDRGWNRGDRQRGNDAYSNQVRARSRALGDGDSPRRSGEDGWQGRSRQTREAMPSRAQTEVSRPIERQDPDQPARTWSGSRGNDGRRDGDDRRNGSWNRDGRADSGVQYRSGDRDRSDRSDNDRRGWSRDNDRDQRNWGDRDRNSRDQRNWSDRDRNSRDQRDWNDRDRRNWNDRDRNGWNDRDRRDYRRWDNRSWRDDRRYDWRDYRTRNRTTFRLGVYYSPYRNYSYRRLGLGYRLDTLFFGSRYWISDPWRYRLPAVYGPYRWVRYYDDVLLVDTFSGEVVDVIYDFFW